MVRSDLPGFGHSGPLRAKILLALPWLTAAAEEFWAHPSLSEMFPDFLVRVQASARASIAVMAVALGRCEQLAAVDPVAERLVTYYRKHIRDEEEHPDWLLSDMEALGMARHEILAAVPPPTVAALIGPLYFWVHHAHPVALLGFFAVLEGYPPSASHLAEVQQRTGLPAEAFRMMLAHAEIDLHHREELYELLDELPLTPEQSGLVAITAFHTIAGVTEIFRELLAEQRVHG